MKRDDVIIDYVGVCMCACVSKRRIRLWQCWQEVVGPGRIIWQNRALSTHCLIVLGSHVVHFFFFLIGSQFSLYYFFSLYFGDCCFNQKCVYVFEGPDLGHNNSCEHLYLYNIPTESEPFCCLLLSLSLLDPPLTPYSTFFWFPRVTKVNGELYCHFKSNRNIFFSFVSLLIREWVVSQEKKIRKKKKKKSEK